MLYNKETYKIEQRLAEWCRTGKNIDIKGTKKEGLNQYRRLLRNNINSTMKQAFPIADEVLAEKEWDILIDDFFANHKAQTNHVWKLPFEFYQFVQKQSYAIIFNKPFLNDLLYFEWIEIEVHTMSDQSPEPYKKYGDTNKNVKIEVNPEYRLIKLNFPVHLYAAEEAINNSGNYFLLVYRHPEDFEVRFVDLPALHILFFEKIVNEEKTISEILNEIEDASGSENIDAVRNNIIEFVETMFDQKVFLGYKQTYQN